MIYTIATWVYMAIVITPLVLLLLYVSGIQYEAGGICMALIPIVLVGWVLDWLYNWTVFSIVTRDVPSRAEFTISQRLARLILRGGYTGAACLLLACILNALCIGGNHIKLPKGLHAKTSQ